MLSVLSCVLSPSEEEEEGAPRQATTQAILVWNLKSSHLKMNRCGYQQNALGGGCEEMRMESVVCPKPRRFEPIRALSYPINHHSMLGDSVAGSELLDIILSKQGGYGGAERSATPLPSSPPFFHGSPPIRAPNPVIQDAEFGRGVISPFTPGPASPSSSSARKGSGPSRVSFAAVRIEGFDCMGRDRGNCSISALA